MLLLEANNSSHAVHAVWYLVAGVAIVVGILVLKHYINGKRLVTTNVPLPDPYDPANIRETQQNQDLKEHILLILKQFSGSINVLSDVIKEDDIESAEITFRNIELIIEGHGDEMLNKWFIENGHDRESWSIDVYKDKAKQILQALISCGLKSSTEKKLTWNSDTAKYYHCLFKVEEGQICDVLAPCWIYQNQVFEQGLVSASK